MATDILVPALSPVGEDAATPHFDGTLPGLPWLALPDSFGNYVIGSLFVPADVDAGGTVTFRVALLPATAAAAKNVQLRLSHAPLADGEATDVSVAWTNEDSGDIAMDAVQGDVTLATWTETVANLGWVAGDWVPFRLVRIAATANDLVGDVYVLGFQVEVPTA